MRIIISPAKRMKVDADSMRPLTEPMFPEETAALYRVLKSMSLEELQAVLRCNDNLALENYRRYQEMDQLTQATPALFAYQGIQYQYMLPTAFTTAQYGYLQERLLIVSGFYGLLRPFDGIYPYRLQMQAKLGPERSLYSFWGQRIGAALSRDNDLVIDLASAEYSRAARQGTAPGLRWVSLRFGELQNGKLREKGTQVKMARGAMVRYMAEQEVREPEALTEFQELGYRFSPERSQADLLVFCRECE